MTHHAKTLPANWASKTLQSPAPLSLVPAPRAATLNGSAAVAFGVALRYLALKRDTARPPQPMPQRPALRVVP
jgi:hypothetical protein